MKLSPKHLVKNIVLNTVLSEWITTFTSLRSSCQGHQKERVTPYMYIMVYYVIRLTMLHKGLKKLSGQGKWLKSIICRKSKPFNPPMFSVVLLYHHLAVWLTDDWNLKVAQISEYAFYSLLCWLAKLTHRTLTYYTTGQNNLPTVMLYDSPKIKQMGCM